MSEHERYDRQLRLWGSHGQRKLSKSSICCFGSSSVACEILKNLILPGIGSFVIVDDTRITLRDFGQNFFIPSSATCGELRGRVVLETLLQLNPTVKGSFVEDVSELDDQFDVCILGNCLATQKIHAFANACKYVIEANSIGFIGRIVCEWNQPHLVLEAKSEEGRIENFRLTNPWPKLTSFSNQAFDEDVLHVPFFAILVKAASIAASPTKAALVDAIKSLAPDGMIDHTENFQQAVANTYRITALVEDSEIVCELKKMVATSGHLMDKDFIIVVNAIIGFHEKHDCLPLIGSSLPDMISSSHMYTQLCDIYRERANEDFDEIFKRCDGLDADFVRLVVANIRNVRVMLPEEQTEEYLEEAEKEIVDFFETGKLGDRLGKEFERYVSGCEMHSVSSVIGAVGAQEIVKLLTNQFTPIHKQFVFNGINGTAFMTG